jgi:enoyl-CoA hydratase/carnithine racemase
MALELVTVEVDGPVGRLTLDRPAKLNALSPQLLGELVAAARWFDEQRAIKVVIVRGAGRAFCAGFDLDAFVDPSMHPRETGDLGRLMAEAVTSMRAVTIAAIHGRCVGGGLVLAAACDLRIATDDARFSIPEVDLGIPLAWGGIPRLVRELGPAVTKELVMTCREFDAGEAHALRFVNRVVGAGVLERVVEELAASLASKSTLTLHTTKTQVNAVAEEMGSTGRNAADADLLMSALVDPESRDVARRYLEAQGRRSAGPSEKGP